MYDDLVPRARLEQGFQFGGERVGFGSLQKGIHRSRLQRGPAALTLMTSFKDPYADTFDQGGALFTYAYRSGSIDQHDNRALRAAFELQTPVVYFRALAPAQYLVVAPMFVTADDPAARVVVLEPGLRSKTCGRAGWSPGPMSAPTRRARRAIDFTSSASSSTSCGPTVTAARSARSESANCSRRRTSSPTSRPTVSLRSSTAWRCARSTTSRLTGNLLGIDPDGVVHIADRLLREIDGPMLRTGLQGFHGARIAQPRREDERPDVARLQTRFERFRTAA